MRLETLLIPILVGQSMDNNWPGRPTNDMSADTERFVRGVVGASPQPIHVGACRVSHSSSSEAALATAREGLDAARERSRGTGTWRQPNLALVIGGYKCSR